MERHGSTSAAPLLRRQAYFWLAVIMLAVVTALAYRGVVQLVSRDRMVQHTVEVQDKLDALVFALADSDANERGYLLTDDPGYRQSYQVSVAAIGSALQALRGLTQDNPVQQERLGRLAPLIDSKLKSMALALQLHQAHALSQAERDLLERSRALSAQIGAVTGDIVAAESELYRQRSTGVRAQAQTVIAGFAAAVVICLVIISLVFFRVVGEVRGRRRADEALRQLNLELEERVRARTAELVEANAKLQDEIAERRTIGAAYREASETLGALIEAAPFAINCLAPDRRVLIWNKAAERIFGYSAAEVIGKPYPLVPAAGRAEFDAIFKRSAAGEMMRNVHVTRRRKDGSPVEISFASAPLYDRAGQLRGVVGMLEDITERKSTEQQLRQAQKMEAVGQLTGGIAHDFNNLLTIIISNLDLLEERVTASADSVALVESARAAGLRGAELTQRLLAFARKQPLQPQVIDYNERLAGITALLKRTLGEAVSVSASPGPGLWPVFADPMQLENAVMNLAINARDAMPRGGQLVIETANVHLDEHYAGLNPEVAPGDYVMLAVTDTGTGMKPEVAERAFEPFFTTKDVGQGTGLGLSMVYGFARQSGGHAKIYSELGRGTSVKLYLPRATRPGEAAARGAGPASEELPSGGEAILVVEDSAEVRQVAVFMLKQLGYRVHEAENAHVALARLDGPEAIDLMFTDIVMPEGVNGFELAQEAKRRRPGLKILFTSGYSEAFMRTDAARNGNGGLAAEPVLSKPYRKRELAQKVRAALDGSY